MPLPAACQLFVEPLAAPAQSVFTEKFEPGGVPDPSPPATL